MKETEKKKAVKPKEAAEQTEKQNEKQTEVRQILPEQTLTGGEDLERAEIEQAARRKLAEMNLLEDFLFGSVVTFPEIGERFVKILLKIILGREVKHLSVTAQKFIYGADIDLHGARLDVCLEPEIEEGSGENATVYDIEPDRNSCDKKMLPRRTRFYHGKIAARNLNSGADYDSLKDVVVIMILPYDPFGLNRMVYTVRNKCLEEPEMAYEDGAYTVFLYTKGTVGIPSEEVRQLSCYMENSVYGNAVNEDLREIHRMVETVKRDSKVIRMRIQMVEDIMKQAREITRLGEENTKLGEENKKLEEENKKLKEELARKNSAGHIDI